MACLTALMRFDAVGRPGFEPGTSYLNALRLWQIARFWALLWANLDSNQGPLTYQVSALTTELFAHRTQNSGKRSNH